MRNLIEMEGPAPAAGAPLGRPSRIERGWDERTGTWLPESPVGRMLAALRAGVSQTNAASFGQINRNTFASWLARVREHMPTDDTLRSDVDRRQLPYVDFASAVDMALAVLEVTLVNTVRTAAMTDPRMALKLLERRFPHWRDNQPADAGTIEIEDNLGEALMRNPAIAQAAAAYAEALADTGLYGDPAVEGTSELDV